ncbi:uncharacterized protein LOC126319981 [Schistocerca gregaria]|uniref:uncharacterized protein LOC126319981 n=1 Tax=Schistocerca gregaria TaxID=7010 RepID=UPI00211DB864|nr:uncharacterized protein LOC126319981 [Schistocerca gregaria]
MTDDSSLRIAIVKGDRCRPKRCKQECKRSCPVVRIGKLCIEVEPTSKISWISEKLCIGCGICVKKCPFNAIEVINLPKNLAKDTIHRYGPNQFKLHRLPIPRPNQVLGLVGTNGIGKSTALKLLAGKQKPNLGRFDDPPDWKEILAYFRGSELQNYFTRILEDNLVAIIKPQYVDHIPRAVSGKVGNIVSSKDKRQVKEIIYKELDLSSILDREIEFLSGGELQRFAIAVALVQDVDIYIFDEPSSYLDIRQRLKASRAIRGILSKTVRQNYVIVVEHDLAVLDYLSDFVCCLYGQPGVYGVVSVPFNVREGINIFLEGFLASENMRFRDFELTFKMAEVYERDDKRDRRYSYGNMKKALGNFTLEIESGEFTDSEIIVFLGENGMGKTTFIRLLAGALDSDEGSEVPQLNVSYKPQKISPTFHGSVRQLLHKKIPDMYMHSQFQADVMKPLKLDLLMDQQIQVLSGGELQRVALALCLGRPADIYLIDEPSAYLDSEQRIVASKVIKRFILHSKKTAFVVEHDFIMATYLADRVIVYEGTPSLHAKANPPQSLLSGMNKFLSLMSITIRRDPTNYRPRINKYDSIKDREQREAGTYFYLND